MDYSTIYNRVESYISELFERTAKPKLTYHNLQHTLKVVSRAKEIAGHYNLIENDMMILMVSAWFHDTGYLFDEVALHEEKSVQLMRTFMKELVPDNDILNNIEECIMATKPCW